MQSIPATGLSLKETCRLFDNMPVSTLRSIIERETIPTIVERRPSEDGRTRQQVVLPADSLRLVEQYLQGHPEELDTIQPREPREHQPRERREVGGTVGTNVAPAVGDPPRSREVAEQPPDPTDPIQEAIEFNARQQQHIADLEDQVARLIARTRVLSQCLPAEPSTQSTTSTASTQPRRYIAVDVRLRWPAVARSLLNAARSPVAIRLVFASRIICTALVWILYPECIAKRLAPTRQGLQSALIVTANRAKASKLRRAA